MKDGKVDKRRDQGFLTRSIVGRDDDRSGIWQMKPLNCQLRPQQPTSFITGMKQIEASEAGIFESPSCGRLQDTTTPSNHFLDFL